MSNFIVPNTFVPGTKAKAQEVNENFIAVQDELNKKAEKEGDPTQPLVVGDAVEDNQAVTKGQVETYIKNANTFAQSISDSFLIKSGNVDENGEPDILSYENGVVSFKVDGGSVYAPIVAVPANLQQEFTVTSLNSIDLSAYSDGVYNIFVKSDGTAYALCNTICTQKNAPAAALNTIFVNISKSPLSVQKYDGEKWIDFNDVYAGNVTLESGVITSVVNCKFNDNGYSVNTLNHMVVKEFLMGGHGGYIIYNNGFCEQWGRLGTTSNGQVISLLVPYNSSTYLVLMETSISSTSSTYSIKVNSTASSKTANGFTLVKKDTNAQALFWRTFGMLN